MITVSVGMSPTTQAITASWGNQPVRFGTTQSNSDKVEIQPPAVLGNGLTEKEQEQLTWLANLRGELGAWFPKELFDLQLKLFGKMKPKPEST